MVSGLNRFMEIGPWASVSFKYKRHSMISVLLGELAGHTELVQDLIIVRLRYK